MNAVTQEVRRAYIGGSDAAAAVNLSRYKSPLRLWQEKVGEVAEPDLSDNERVHFGIVLEDVVATEFSRRQNVRVMREPRHLEHVAHPFMVAHIDRRIVGVREGLECKTADLRMSKEWGEEDTDSVPMEYLAQCVHYMAVTGWPRWHVALLLGGNEFRMYRIERDEDLVRMLIEKERAFWQCVVDRTPPAPTTIDDVKHLWPQDAGTSINASIECAASFLKLKGLREQMKHLDLEAQELEVAVKAEMKEATTLLGPNGKPLCTWKTQTARRVDVTALREAEPEIAERFTKAAESRVFRIK